MKPETQALIRNQLANNEIALGDYLVYTMIAMVVLAAIFGFVACAISWQRRRHEEKDGTKHIIFEDRWAWIPLLLTAIFVAGAMIMWLTLVKI